MLALIKQWAWCIWSGYTVMGTFVRLGLLMAALWICVVVVFIWWIQ